ncbi:hypothetical protein Bca52824_036675 [Brassica carinata]|uniref:Uncharacterized protein n=1 Tax=Brassica carinata TaxID=52824 RepID=A0A8X7S397_BRACI|nr:hypothetical protein Bca52824_036675 [Brassica carinata]
MASYFTANNLDANYVKVFRFASHPTSSKRGSQRRNYLYGVLLMAIGHTKEGIKVINKLTEKERITVVEICWTAIQPSLTNIALTMKDIYINTVCANCYHFYLMTEFIEMVMGLNSPSRDPAQA